MMSPPQDEECRTSHPGATVTPWTYVFWAFIYTLGAAILVESAGEKEHDCFILRQAYAYVSR